MSNPSSPIAEVTADQAQPLLAAGAFLLDVREDDEWRAGHAPDAVHIPMGEVVERSAEVSTGSMVVCICRSGGRSLAVANALRDLGLDARNLTGGMHSWESSGLPVVTDSGATGQVI